MPTLTATYLIPLSSSLRLQREKNDALEYSLIIDDFTVTMRIVSNEFPSSKAPGQLAITLASDVQVRVSRDEEEEPPAVPTNAHGGRNFFERSKWIGDREKEYKRAALVATNRLLTFFKYDQRTPDLQLLHEYFEGLYNPTWSDENGHKVESGRYTGVASLLRESGVLGERNFTEADDTALRDALQSDQEVSVARQLLSDAQSSVLSGNYRRGVLEMAIACEVAIKQAFFKAATPAGSAFEYLEDKGKVNFRAIDLLHGPALEAFSTSFRDSNAAEFQHLDYLFRCRNKVAHRALAEYRDDLGSLHSIDQKTLELWWQSVERLFQWLQISTGQVP